MHGRPMAVAGQARKTAVGRLNGLADRIAAAPVNAGGIQHGIGPSFQFLYRRAQDPPLQL